MPPSDKATILIDGGYFDYVNQYARDEFGSPIDLVALSEKLCDEFDVDHLRTKYYHALPYQDDQPTQDQISRRQGAQSFFDTIDGLRNCQFEQKGRVREEYATCSHCGRRHTTESQKGVDVGIAVDLVRMAFDQHSPGAFILFSGDEDMKHAVRAAKDTHSQVYLAYAYNRQHNLYSAQNLRQEVDHQVNVADGFLSDALQ